MLILNTPICPKCEDAVMSREFSRLDYVAMALLIVLFFPAAIWIYLTPRTLRCQHCGKVLSARGYIRPGG